MKLVFFGAPGAGKGTIAKLLFEKFGIPQISTGDLFRAAIKNKTELGKKVSTILENGQLVPDEVTISIVVERIKEDDCKNGYILDGFPRTLVQAESFENVKPISLAIFFNITDEEVKERLGGRRVCESCGAIYHIKNNKPKKDGVCNKDNAKLIIRPDDREEAIVKRLEVYHNQTEPLIDYYKKISKLVVIDASLPPEEVVKQICEKVNF